MTDYEKWQKENTKKLPNGHTLHNIKNEKMMFEDWTDELGNDFTKSKGKINCTPKEVYAVSVGFTCICPFCNDQVDIEILSDFLIDEEVECPGCENHFTVYYEP